MSKTVIVPQFSRLKKRSRLQKRQKRLINLAIMLAALWLLATILFFWLPLEP
jgi:O-antigen/teichoic acid export membrane protein